MDSKLSCTITGHKPQRLKFKYNEQAPLCQKIKVALTKQIKKLYQKGVKVFYIGCAVGVDTWAAETIIELKQQTDFSDMKLFCAIPFPEQSDTFTASQKKRYQNILDYCNNKEVINRHHSPVAYKRLNYYMIDNTQYLLAVYDQDRNERNGLGQTVNYAIKKGLQITFIHPDTAEVSEYKTE